ncbi:1331_t:CDS:2 [Funneliformis geosporum]|uniref:19580_t:CDS:1 n=1 Tax=Funneliformis geosporum TaxID=1117311 RepID=A0A9W4WRN2_9GLOM|nr:1331_t:CDS:2 [Funneliformis geosporum]CAI2181258.1 19580_t:CDS:2 [Funneliformis geosporum]
MGVSNSTLFKRVNAIRDEYNGRRRGTHLDRDPQTTPTRYDRKFIILGGSNKSKIRYPLPSNADEEKSWLEDLQHYLSRHLWQSNFSSPIEKLLKRGARVLDLGCGIPTWTFEMAKEFPKSKFTVVDFTPIPTNHHVKNIEIVQHSLSNLPFEDNLFDLVFVRLGGFSDEDWEDVLKDSYRITTGGGWIEFMQMDSRFSNCGPYLEKWNDVVASSDSNSDKLEDMLLKRNFPNLRHEVAIVPIGSWGKKTGELLFAYMRHLLCKVKSEMTETDQPGIIDELDRIMERADQECAQNKTYGSLHRFMAQKRF